MYPQRFTLKLLSKTLQWPLRDGDTVEISMDGKAVGAVDIALIKAFLMIELQRMKLVGQFDLQMNTAHQLMEEATVRMPPKHAAKRLPSPDVLRAQRMSRKPRPKSGQSAPI